MAKKTYSYKMISDYETRVFKNIDDLNKYVLYYKIYKFEVEIFIN